MQRRLFLGALIAVAFAGAAHGQAWPTKQTIRLISPFPPGSAVDAVARPVFDNVSRQIGQAIVFESRPGAGGTIGMAAVAKAEPDGYTLLVNSSVHTITPSTYSKLPYDTVRDFAGIIPLAQFPNVLVVPPSRFKTIQELVAVGKAKPGSITYGSGGVGAATHLNAERFRLSAGFTAVHVPFKGAPEALREILGNRIDFYFAPILSAVPLIESHELRGLAVSSLKRSCRISGRRWKPAIPIPTMCSGSACSHRRRRRATSSRGSTTPPPRRSPTRPSRTISQSSAPRPCR
jgi:tripartite-type tricarboxylate transporter receptor subunit TctC